MINYSLPSPYSSSSEEESLMYVQTQNNNLIRQKVITNSICKIVSITLDQPSSIRVYAILKKLKQVFEENQFFNEQPTSLRGGGCGRSNPTVASIAPEPQHEYLTDNFSQVFVKHINDELCLIGHTEPVQNLAFSPNGYTLASGGLDKTIRLWDLKTAKQIRLIETNNKPVSSLAFSPNGHILASVSPDQIYSPDFETNETSNYLTTFCPIAFSPFGNILASGSRFFIICLWFVNTGKQLYHEFRQPTDPYSDYFSQGILLWNVSTGKIIVQLKEEQIEIKSIIISSDGKILVVSSNTIIQFWNIKIRVKYAQLAARNATKVSFLHETNILAMVDEDCLKLFNINTRQIEQIFVINFEEISLIQSLHFPFEKVGQQFALVVENEAPKIFDSSPYCQIWSSCSQDNIIRLRNFTPQNFFEDVNCKPTMISSGSVSPNANTMTSRNQNYKIQFWNFENCNQNIMIVATSTITSLVLSPDSKAYNNEVMIQVWKDEVRKFTHHFVQTVNSIVFFRHDDQLLSSSQDKNIRIWGKNQSRQWCCQKDITVFESHKFSQILRSRVPDITNNLQYQREKNVHYYLTPKIVFIKLTTFDTMKNKSHFVSYPLSFPYFVYGELLEQFCEENRDHPLKVKKEIERKDVIVIQFYSLPEEKQQMNFRAQAACEKKQRCLHQV